MSRSLAVARSACVAVAAAVLSAAAVSGQVRPDVSYRVLGSEHFDVTYGPGLEALARRVLEAAERSRALLVEELTEAPEGRIDILLVDAVDFSNGFASPFPSNRIVLYARPPVDDEALSYSTDWVELVVSHELTHTFELDRAGSVGRLLRSVFGRMPLIFPMFPAVGTPSWSTEGLAVVTESAYTGQGRAHGSEHEMIVRTAVLAGRPDRMDRLNESSPIWPGGQRVYIYGSLFMEWLAERHGEDALSRMLDATASAVLPPFLFFDRVASRALGETFDEAYDAWLAELDRKYRAQADSLRATGLTESRPLTEHGRLALYPRMSPDGRRLVYVADDGRSNSAARVIDAGTGAVVESVRRNGIGVQDWTLDGALVLSQFEFDGPYAIWSDLWRVGPDGGRLTRGERLQAPDVNGAGRIVAVANSGGATTLVLVDGATSEVHPITPEDPRTLWSFPRWSPDGSRIAASRWTGEGDHSIVIMDSTGAVLTTVTRGISLDLAPAWSPDGRYLLFSSDRTGIANLYAADLSVADSPRLWQVTNVLTGAFQPEVSPDGRTVFFSRYHADGYAIERIPFDPATWRPPAASRLHAEPRAGGAAGGTTDDDDSAMTPPQIAAQATSRPYSAWRTLKPMFWAPVLTTSDEAGRFAGFSLHGEDLISRHAFRAAAAFDVEGSGRWEGGLSYSNAWLGNPVLTLRARRNWDGLGRIVLPDSTTSPRIERDDAVSAFMTLVFRRWRTSATLSAGVERQWYRQQILDTHFRLRDPEDTQTNLIGSFAIANTQLPPFAISREDGFTFAITAERSLEDESTALRDSTGIHPEDYTDWRTVAAVYKSIDAWGFAHHVFALRGSGFLSTGPGAGLQRLGGASGSYAELLGFGVSGGSRLLPVRGFTTRAIAGTRAWTATAEWRIPIALVGRRPGWSPIFIDRVAANIFVDAGDAWCSAEQRTRSQSCRAIELLETPLVGAGAELSIDMGFAGIFRARLRGGFGVPLRGPQDRTRSYLLIGSNF